MTITEAAGAKWHDAKAMSLTQGARFVDINILVRRNGLYSYSFILIKFATHWVIISRLEMEIGEILCFNADKKLPTFFLFGD